MPAWLQTLLLLILFYVLQLMDLRWMPLFIWLHLTVFIHSNHVGDPFSLGYLIKKSNRVQNLFCQTPENKLRPCAITAKQCSHTKKLSHTKEALIETQQLQMSIPTSKRQHKLYVCDINCKQWWSRGLKKYYCTWLKLIKTSFVIMLKICFDSLWATQWLTWHV